MVTINLSNKILNIQKIKSQFLVMILLRFFITSFLYDHFLIIMFA